ncbi:MAG: hypothetical protein H6510_02545 [Acidobacteria bacterium]|nr:hypothetical protein [Acidobacteriota bacterium]
MTKRCWVLGFLLISVGLSALATVDINCNAQFVALDSGPQLAGPMTLTVDGDDFFEAGPTTPEYIRITLQNGATLAQTLVDIQSAPSNNQPIYLAMRLDNTQTDWTLTADPQAVSIVRWREGENQIYLKVTQQSNKWLFNGTQNQAPDYNNRVAFQFGVDARFSYQINAPLLAVQRANRLANSRDSSTNPTELNFMSTLFCIHLDSSQVQPFPSPESKVQHYVVSYDYQTTGVETEPLLSSIVWGDQTSANFSGTDTIAIAQSAINIQSGPAENQPGLSFCSLSGQETPLQGQIRFQHLANIPWFAGAQVVLNLDPDSTYGFPTGAAFVDSEGQSGFFVETAYFGAPFSDPGTARCYDADGTFMTPGGTRLTRKVYVTANESFPSDSFEGELVATLIRPNCAPETPQVMVTLRSPKGPQYFIESGPYQGSQNGCAPLFWETPTYVQTLGSYALLGLENWPMNPSLLNLVQWVNQGAFHP